MSAMQSHDYFELYFLLNGNREIFIENKLYLLHSGSMCVIRPFDMHKTEGAAYERVNIYIDKDLLSDAENELLIKISEHGAVSFDQTQFRFISNTIKEAALIEIADTAKRQNFLYFLSKTVIAYLQTQTLTPLQASITTIYPHRSDPLILKIAAYINQSYARHLTLEHLQKTFFISKNTLCRRFRKQMNCSPVQYITHIRINKSKRYLKNTNKQMGEIAELCGFPSANYFSIIFTKQVGMSPLNYRKKQ